MAGGAKQGRAASRRPGSAGVAPISPATAGATEQVVARLHSSGRRLLLPELAVILVCGAAGYLAGRFSEPWENAAVPLVAATLVLFVGVFPFLFWANRVYVVTTRRVIARRGFFTRERSELLHSRANEVTLRRGPLQALFRSGTVAIRTGSGDVFRLVDVPDALLVRAAIVDLMEHSSGISPVRSRQHEATRRPFDP